MAFTAPELVRKHLNEFRLGETSITDVSVTLEGSAPVQLPHSGLVSGTVIVRAHRPPSLTVETVTLENDWINLNHGQLRAHSVVAASDSSLGTLYFENTDFVIDYESGRITRVVAGAIGSGQSVIVWYDRDFVYSEGSDFTVDLATGLLTRRTNGAIADGQRVTVDYNVALGTVSDEVLELAIHEAGEAVLALISDTYHDQPTSGIIIGETHWAVAAVCRIRAANTLSDAVIPANQARSVAQAWIDLANQYDESGRRQLSRYAKAVTPLRTGRKG